MTLHEEEHMDSSQKEQHYGIQKTGEVVYDTDEDNLSINSTSGKDGTEIENMGTKPTSDTSDIEYRHCTFETNSRFDYRYHSNTLHLPDPEDLQNGLNPAEQYRLNRNRIRWYA